MGDREKYSVSLQAESKTMKRTVAASVRWRRAPTTSARILAWSTRANASPLTDHFFPELFNLQALPIESPDSSTTSSSTLNFQLFFFGGCRRSTATFGRLSQSLYDRRCRTKRSTSGCELEAGKFEMRQQNTKIADHHGKQRHIEA